MKKKTVQDMTIRELMAVPDRKGWDSKVPLFTSLVLIPQRKLHDSGYRRIVAVACEYGRPICKVTWSSDVIALDGIGGYGEWKAEDGVPRSLPPKGWCIDFLPKSGCAQIFCNDNMRLRASLALSTFSLYAKGST